MSEGNLGHCRFCGQSQIVTTIGDTSQEQRDEMATSLCSCAAAVAEKKKEIKESKKRDYLERFGESPARTFMSRCIEAVDCNGLNIEYVQVRMADGYTHKFYLNKDCDLRIKVTKKNEEEISF